MLKKWTFFIVDAISTFLADPFDMKSAGVDVMIAGSQKALACPPGVSLSVLGPKALKRIEMNKSKCMYLDFKAALADGERGQTPFTPAVSVLLQINARLKDIDKRGVEQEFTRVKTLAQDFRSKIKSLPFEICPDQ